MLAALTVEKLTKIYRNGFKALKGIDLTVDAGDFFALLGPNGAGKTTLIGIIASLVNKTSGQVRIFNYDIDNNVLAAKSCLGLVPQEFNFSIFEKVEQILLNQAGFQGLSRKVAKIQTEKYLKLLQLWDKRDVAARMLSGGMKRRLMIARALVHEPKLLILDEPTAGVDIEIRRSMWQLLRDINANGTTIILTTHYLEEAENLCRRVAIIDRGQIIENSTMQSLLIKLKNESVLLYLREAMHAPPLLPGFGVKLIDPLTLEIELDSAKTLNDLFAELSRQNIYVYSFRNKANRLEELFMHLVTEQ